MRFGGSDLWGTVRAGRAAEPGEQGEESKQMVALARYFDCVTKVVRYGSPEARKLPPAALDAVGFELVHRVVDAYLKRKIESLLMRVMEHRSPDGASSRSSGSSSHSSSCLCRNCTRPCSARRRRRRASASRTIATVTVAPYRLAAPSFCAAARRKTRFILADMYKFDTILLSGNAGGPRGQGVKTRGVYISRGT